MPDREGVVVVGALAAYNLIQNLWLPQRAYVPANLAATAALVALARSYGCSWDQLGLDRSRVRSGLAVGAVGVIGAVGAGVALAATDRGASLLLDQRAADQSRGDVIFRSLVRFPLGTALFEEVAFRGVLYGVWCRNGSTQRAAAATALTFGAWHLIPTRDALTGNPLEARVTTRASRVGMVATGALATALSSLGFTYMRNRSRSVIAPWLTHAAINSVGYLLGVAAWRRAAMGAV